MIRHISLFVIGALAAASSTRAEDPKFAQLKTKTLITATAPDLNGGVIFPGGALDLSANPIAMIHADFKSPEGIRFVHVKMIYKGEYTDPSTQIAGFLYHLKDQSYDRYFFVSKLNIVGTNANERHVIDYDTAGTPLAYFRGKFALRP